MTWAAGHYAVDPGKTHEDAIDFVNAEPLIKAGIRVNQLPRFPARLGAMTPAQWCHLPADEVDPQYRTKFSFPMIMKATARDVKGEASSCEASSLDDVIRPQPGLRPTERVKRLDEGDRGDEGRAGVT